MVQRCVKIQPHLRNVYVSLDARPETMNTPNDSIKNAVSTPLSRVVFQLVGGLRSHLAKGHNESHVIWHITAQHQSSHDANEPPVHLKILATNKKSIKTHVRMPDVLNLR